MRALPFIAALVLAAPASAQSEITIGFDAPIGTIAPEVHGQFVEHLGTQVYGGLWVGRDSDIPNTDGIRDDVFAALDALDVPVMRWPGGCYADQYHWRDGIGTPRTQRDNLVWGHTPEPGTFGTHEFFNLAERLGAKTYLNLNLGSGTVREAAEWLEYITSSSESALAQERRANGREEPWTIDYLTFGNETWDCGGNMRAQYYGDLYAQFATFAKTAGEQPYRVLSGSHDGNPEYTGELLAHPETAALAEGVSLHFYTLPTGDWGTKGAALGFPEQEWASAIARTLRMDAIIERQLAEMDARTGDRKLGLVVDEWGVWTDTLPGDPALHQQNTIRDAVVAALNLNIFNAHADRVPMANIAQMVNVLQAMILTDGPRMLLTPTYHVFMMYKPFQGATALPVSVSGPEYHLGEVAFPALSASAALTPGGELLVAVVNADAREAHAVEFAVGNRSLVGAQVLSGASLDAHNSFERPDAVEPADARPEMRGSTARYAMPARSVLVARFR